MTTYALETVRTVPILDLRVTPMDQETLLARLAREIASGGRVTVAGHNLHSAYLMRTEAPFRRFYEQAEVRLIDGMPLLALLGLHITRDGRARLGPRHRLGSTDWVPQAVHLPAVRRVALLGASASSNAGAAEKLSGSTGGGADDAVEVLSLPADPWSPEDLDDVVARLRAFAPEILLIGMGMPLQERIATALRARTEIPVIATVGGAIDQLSGAQSLAPRWLGRIGLEWAWRLASDPRRFAGRYLVEPLRLARLILRGAA